MKKMKTLFKKDINDLGRVTKEFDEENKWVLDNSIPYRKLDGTSCAVINGELYKRYDAKIDKGTKKYRREIPEGAISCQEPDYITGHHPHWVKCKRDDNSNKYHFEAFDHPSFISQEGTYELVGKKINKNPERFVGHKLIPHNHFGSALFCFDISRASDYDYVKEYLKDKDIEGIVFHGENGKKCKIRKKDFGMKR